MVDVNYTHIIVLLDASGSMFSMRDATTSNFNEMLKEQQGLPGKATMSIYQFNYTLSQCAPPMSPVGSLEPLSNYHPSGGTALLDSLYSVIQEEGKRLSALPEEARPGKVVAVVITDGQENASTYTTRDQLASLVSQQENVYAWNFLYLGANMDAFSEASAIGIRAGNTVNYSNTALGLEQSYGLVSSTLGAVRSRGDLAQVKYTAFNAENAASVNQNDLASTIAVDSSAT